MDEPPRKNLLFEDFAVGRTFATAGRTISEADILLFAGISGDYTRLHLDAEFAKTTHFGSRVAHGMLGVSVATGLVAQLGTLEDTAMALLEFSCRFTAPIRIGDTVHVRKTVTEARATSKPDRGIVTFQLDLINQKGETVFTGSEKVMVRRRT